MSAPDPLSEIERLAEMKERGVISPEDYEAKKQELLARVGREPGAAPAEVVAAMRRQRIDNAFLFELVGGVLGLLGVGYIYAGRTNDGVARLIVWWLVLGAMWTTVAFLSAILIGLCMVPLCIVAQLGVPLYSANRLKLLLEAETASPPH